MATHGGKRNGAGRKRVHDEIEARDIAIKAIKSVYGSLEDGMIALLKSGEASLQRFVFEHAVGKAPDRVQHSSDPDNPVIFKIDGRFKDATGDNS